MANGSVSAVDGTVAAVKKWAQSLTGRRKSLAPWDEFAYFDTPYEIGTLVNISGITPVIGTDVRRVWIEFQVSNGPDITISCTNFANNSPGTILKAGQQPLRYIQQWDGPMPQVAWYAQSPGGSNTLTIRYVTLREWPK